MLRPKVFWIPLLLVVAACTRSAPNGGGEGLLPEQIALTLTAAPTLPPTRTPPPTATPQPSSTPVPAATSTDSATATSGPSPTATPPPLPTDDPRYGLNLSAPDEVDDFSIRYGWFEYNAPGNAIIEWERGQLQATDLRADGYLWWSTSGVTASDFYAEVEAEAGECQGQDTYGMAVRIGGAGYDRGYTLEISCDGRYRMRKFISGITPETLLDWTASDAIEPGPGASNRIGFVANQSMLVGLVNGTVLEPTTDTDFVFGNFGLFAEARDSAQASVRFTRFSLWHFPP